MVEETSNDTDKKPEGLGNREGSLQYKCANCGQPIKKLNDDTPKKNFCKSCESPNCNPVQRRAFFEKKVKYHNQKTQKSLYQHNYN